MPAYSFKLRFVPFVKDGSKNQTIRAKRKYQVKPGDKLYLYYGMRTKWCKKLKEAICKDVEQIIIYKNGNVTVAGEKLSEWRKDCLAYSDGFRVDNSTSARGTFEIMYRWFRQTHDLPFKGDIIYW